METKFKEVVLGDNLYVSLDESESFQKDASGIFLRPDAKNKGMRTGVIFKRGEAVQNERLQPGVKILFARFAGCEVEIENVKCAKVNECDVDIAWVPMTEEEKNVG